MTITTRFQTRTRIVAGLALGALVVAGAACSKTDETSTSATTAKPAATSAPAKDGGAATTSTEAPATTKAPKKEVGNAEVKAGVSASHPDLWALVDYSVMSWDAFSGFTIPVPAGTDVAKATELCEAVSDVVYEGSASTVITIAGGVSMDNLSGTPIVVRNGKSGTCAAA